MHPPTKIVPIYTQKCVCTSMSINNSKFTFLSDISDVE